jgi:predicted Rossmann fold flavoprotein
MCLTKKRNIAIIGGGASGIFASIRCAEIAKEKKIDVDICVFEASTNFLRKVRISGGGRCNVTHHLLNIKDFSLNYPRGQKELLSPFQKFQATDTIKWFEDRGVNLKHERDGRMFPITDRSETIIDCFIKETNKHKVKLLNKKNVNALIKRQDGRLTVSINEGESFIADSVLIATGSKPLGYKLATALGHSITEIAPSLFTFKIDDPILENLSGTSFSNATLTLKIKKTKPFIQTGALLITHWGLSGPALLKLSAWAAREMMHASYKARIVVNWLSIDNKDDAEKWLKAIKKNNTKTSIGNAYPKELTKRFWLQLLKKCSILKEKNWSEISKNELNQIIENLVNCELDILGKSRFKEEFVECGGVNLKEINLRTMESKICSGLFFSGEVMDIDGITGGFNFQSAWTSGWIAGSNMALKIESSN